MNFYIQCLRPAAQLISNYEFTKDEKYFIYAKNICVEWARLHPYKDKDKHSKFAWYDMAVGLRSINLAYVIDIGERENLISKEEYDLLYNALIENLEWLMDDENITFSSNHGFYQIVSQIIVGKSFYYKDKIFQRTYKIGKKRLNKIIKRQIFNEGIHKENSPEYHFIVCELMQSLNKKGILNYKQRLLSNRLNNNSYWFILPNGKLLNFGDSNLSLVKKDIYDSNINRKEFKFFKKSAYFIVKTNTSYFAQHLGFVSKVHKHADDLSMFWYDLNQNILVDSGSYGYMGETEKGSELRKRGFRYANPNRIYVEETRAHNTVEFNNESNYRDRQDRYKNAVKSLKRKDGNYIITSEVNLRGKILNRTVVFKPEKYLIVYDKFHSTKDGEISNAKQWFQLDPDLNLIKKDNNYIIELKNNNKITVKQLNTQIKEMNLYKGLKEPQMQGWVSFAGGEIIPTYSFNYEIKDKNQDYFLTTFEINDNKISTDLIEKILKNKI